MARVQVDDETWREFRVVAGGRSISEVLGELVEALARARDRAEDLQAIVTRLESLREP